MRKNNGEGAEHIQKLKKKPLPSHWHVASSKLMYRSYMYSIQFGVAAGSEEWEQVDGLIKQNTHG